MLGIRDPELNDRLQRMLDQPDPTDFRSLADDTLHLTTTRYGRRYPKRPAEETRQ